MKIADFPFDDYVLFSNGSIVEAMWINVKNIKQEGNSYFYECMDYENPTSCVLIKSRYKALYMSNDKKELQNLQKK